MSTIINQNNQSLKYKLKEILATYPKAEYSRIINTAFSSGISKPSFYKWLNILRDAKECIPSDGLRVLAALLNTTMEELYNNPIDLK